MSAFAARYARAFADVVGSAHLPPDEIKRQLSEFAGALDESPELRSALANPAISVDDRIRVIDALASRLGLQREVRNFLAVLIRHERMNSFADILGEFRAELDRREGISEAEIATARPLGAGERRELESRVAQLAGSQIRARFREDPSLIGGVVVKIGSTVYDGSVRGRLGRLKDELVAG